MGQWLDLHIGHQGSSYSNGHQRDKPHCRSHCTTNFNFVTSQIQFRTPFQLEHHDKCNFDYLKFYNGGEATSPSIDKFCSDDKPHDITSQSNEVRVEFYTDGSSSATGFKFDWTASSQGG